MSEEDLANNKTYISDFDITKHIVLDNESNYWYSAEYVDKMLKKQDKEIEHKLYQEWLEWKDSDCESIYVRAFEDKAIYDYIQELKGVDKE